MSYYPAPAEVASMADLRDLTAADLMHLRSQAAQLVAEVTHTEAERLHATRLLGWLRAELADRALQELAEAEHAAALALLHQAERLGVHHHLTGGGYDQLHTARLLIATGRAQRTQGRHLVAEVHATLTDELATIARREVLA